MTRAELIHQMALMTDEELENCIQIYKDGGKSNEKVDTVTQESKPTPQKPKTFEEFFKMLPDDEAQAFREGRYNWIRAFELAPWEEIVNHLIDPNTYHMHDFYWNSNGEGEFMKNKNYPHLYDYNEDPNEPQGEIGWYLHSPEAESFRNEYDLDDSGIYPKYKKKVKKHVEGGPLDQSSSNTQYDLSKLFNAINTVSGGDKDATKRKYDNYDSFVQLYNSIIKPVYNYLRNKGFTSQQSAGIMGNILQESKFDTYNNGKGLTNMVSDKLNNYKKVYPEGGWQNHLNYVWDWAQGNLYQDKTVNHNYKSKNYREADHSTPQSSATAFHDFFERPASSTSLPLRKGWADVFYRWFNDPIGFYKEGGELEFTNLQDLANELNVEVEPEYKQVKLCKEGSILDQLKQQLPDSEIFDLMKNFGIDELLEGGLKKGSTVSIQIVLEDLKEDSNKPSKELKDIEIGDKSYKVEVVSSEEDMTKGLGNRKSLDKDKGMLFDFGEVQEEVTFNCEEMQFPIDIIFINDEDEVIRVAENCQPGKDLFTESNVRYVLEVNANSGITKEDELDLDPQTKEPIMKVLAPDGSTQMELQGGERIFSRIKTRQLIKWAKRAEKTKKDSDYKHLGNIMFKEIKAQDSRPAEYVEVPE